MTPFQQFEINLASATSYIEMYKELRRLKGLGQRGQLDRDNLYLMWLPRAAVVTSMGALDAYVHQVLYTKVPAILANDPQLFPDALCEAVSDMVPIKKASDVKAAMKYIQSNEPHRLIFEALKEDKFQYASYQAPDKIYNAYKFIGVVNIFQEVAARWPGPRTTDDNIKRRLQGYYKRRNQIAHEGDFDSNHRTRVIAPNYSIQCKDFIEALVTKLNDVVFPAPPA